MNSSRASISRTTGKDISFSCSDNFKFLKKSCASFIDKVDSSKIFMPPEVGPRAPLRYDLCRKTFKASTRKRAPWHTSHTSSPPKYLVPSPLQPGQAP